jgi:hypothetical protein
MVAELRTIADPGQAVGTDRVEVLLTKREVGAAELAARRFLAPRGTAGGTSHNRGVVLLRARNRHNRSAAAAEPAADRTIGRIILPPAGGTGDEQTHTKYEVQSPKYKSCRLWPDLRAGPSEPAASGGTKSRHVHVSTSYFVLCPWHPTPAPSGCRGIRGNPQPFLLTASEALFRLKHY